MTMKTLRFLCVGQTDTLTACTLQVPGEHAQVLQEGRGGWGVIRRV